MSEPPANPICSGCGKIIEDAHGNFAADIQYMTQKCRQCDLTAWLNYQRGHDDGWNRAMKCIAEMIRAGVNIEIVRVVAERKGK